MRSVVMARDMNVTCSKGTNAPLVAGEVISLYDALAESLVKSGSATYEVQGEVKRETKQMLPDTEVIEKPVARKRRTRKAKK